MRKIGREIKTQIYVSFFVVRRRPYDLTSKTSEVRPPMAVLFAFSSHYPYGLYTVGDTKVLEST